MRARLADPLARRAIVALAALALAALALPAPAVAIPVPDLPDLTPDLPGPGDLVEAMFKFLLETFFGIEARVTRRVVEFLVAHPIYSDAGRYPELTELRSYVS